MFLSIIIPIYNDEKYLNECLDSCLDQDFPNDDYEIICVDDGSTDRTPEMLREYAENHSNIRLVFKEHGVRGGRTVGFELAQGDFVWFVDHDDFIASNAVPELKEFVSLNPGCERVTFPYYLFYEKLSKKEQEYMQNGKLSPNDEDRFVNKVVWTSIFKRSFLLENKIELKPHKIDEAGEYWEIPNFWVYATDTFFVRTCIESGIHTERLESRPFYYYRRNDSSQSLSFSKESFEKRDKLRYHRALLYLYLALQKKRMYDEQRKHVGVADEETTVDAVVSLREATDYIAALPRRYWIQAMKAACAKEAFFNTSIKEYNFKYKDYIKLKSRGERFSLTTFAFYYSYTIWGTRLLHLLKIFGILVEDNQFASKIGAKIKKRHNVNSGTKR